MSDLIESRISEIRPFRDADRIAQLEARIAKFDPDFIRALRLSAMGLRTDSDAAITIRLAADLLTDLVESLSASLDPSSAPSETPDYRRQVTMSESTVRDYHRLREALGVGPNVSFDHCITLVRQYVYYGENPPARSSSITGSATEAADRIRKVIARRAARSRVQNYEPTMVTVGIADLEAVLALAAGEQVGAAARSPDREAGSGTDDAGTCIVDGGSETLHCLTHGVSFERGGGDRTPETCRETTWRPPRASSHPVPSEGGGE